MGLPVYHIEQQISGFLIGFRPKDGIHYDALALAADASAAEAEDVTMFQTGQGLWGGTRRIDIENWV